MQIYLLISFFLLVISKVGVASHDYSYTPKDYLLLNCGDTSPTPQEDAYFRNWTSDQHLVAPNPTLKEAQAQPLDTLFVPFTTARIFDNNFTYRILLSPGRVFLRLYFYAGVYTGYNFKTANFSVVVDGKTFLRNLNVYQITQTLGVEYLIKEYSVFVAKPPLELTFTSSSTFGFINGIEVVSMPNDLYKIPNSPPNLTTLELVSRLNVGGVLVPPTRDIGLFRTWNYDRPYVVGNPGIESLKDTNVTIRFPKGAPHLAPIDVYSSFREMTSFPGVNLKFNLTWRLSVDFGFNYMVRMHFCEILASFNQDNQVVFDIYINNRMVESGVDIIELAGGVGIPYVMEFLVDAFDGEILVVLYPNISSIPDFINARLNGLEVLKVNNSEGSLLLRQSSPTSSAPPTSPARPPSSAPPTSSAQSKRSYNRALIFFSILVFLVCCFHNNGIE